MECHDSSAAAQPWSAVVDHSSYQVRGGAQPAGSRHITGDVRVNKDDLDVDPVTKETCSGRRLMRLLTHSTATRVVCTSTRMILTPAQKTRIREC